MKLVECENLTMIKGVPFPDGERFRDIIVTGPPGSGKSTLVEQLGGWSEEAYLDLANKGWWRSEALAFRPREVHFGFPFFGQKESLAVFEKAWLDAPERIDFRRVKLPARGKRVLSTDWSRKYVFDFLLPDPELVFALRCERAQKYTHHVDKHLKLEHVQHQVSAYFELAIHFHQNGLRVQVRESFSGNPKVYS